jgi:hypothetical protein
VCYAYASECCPCPPCSCAGRTCRGTRMAAEFRFPTIPNRATAVSTLQFQTRLREWRVSVYIRLRVVIAKAASQSSSQMTRWSLGA